MTESAAAWDLAVDGFLGHLAAERGLASATLEGRIDMGEKVIINIKTFFDGHSPPDRVHPAML